MRINNELGFHGLNAALRHSDNVDSFAEGPDGEICVLMQDGKIFKIAAE